MNFTDFLESHYIQSNKKYSETRNLKFAGKCQATQDLIAFQRYFFKVFSYFELFFDFVVIKLHLKKAPLSAVELIQSAIKSSEEKVSSTNKSPNLHVVEEASLAESDATGAVSIDG